MPHRLAEGTRAVKSGLVGHLHDMTSFPCWLRSLLERNGLFVFSPMVVARRTSGVLRVVIRQRVSHQSKAAEILSAGTV